MKSRMLTCLTLSFAAVVLLIGSIFALRKGFDDGNVKNEKNS